MTSIDKIARDPNPLSLETLAGGRVSLEDAGVWLVVPCYKVTAHILNVIAKTPEWVEGIVCVDDACPDGSADFIEANNTDPRVVVVRLPGIRASAARPWPATARRPSAARASW